MNARDGDAESQIRPTMEGKLGNLILGRLSLVRGMLDDVLQVWAEGILITLPLQSLPRT